MSFTNKKYVAFIQEDTKGLYKAPTAITFPITDVELPSPDPAKNEYGRPANGKMSRGRWFSGVISNSLGFNSFFILPGDPLTEPAPNFPLFHMAGAHTVDNKIVFDKNPYCETFSLHWIALGCYAQGATAPTGHDWKLRGGKADLTWGADAVGSPIAINASSMFAVESTQGDGVATLPVPDFSTVAWDRFIGGTYELGGTVLEPISWSAVVGNATAMRKNPAKYGNADYAYINDLDITVTVNVYKGATTTAWWDEMISNNNVGDLDLSGSLYQHLFKTCEIVNYTEGDDEGLGIVTLELKPKGNTEIIPL